MTEIIIRKDIFSSVVNRAKVVSKTNSIQIEFDGKDLSFSSSEVAERVKVQLPVDGLVATLVTEGTFKRGLGGNDLLKCIAAIRGEDVRLIFNEENNVFTLQGAKKKNVIDLPSTDSHIDDAVVVDENGKDEVQIKLGDVQEFEDLYYHFEAVIKAASKKDSQPVLGGVLVKLQDKSVLFQATDSHRFYRHEYQCDPGKFMAITKDRYKRIDEFEDSEREKILKKEFVVSAANLEKATSIFGKKDPTALFLSDRIFSLTSKQIDSGVVTFYTTNLLVGKYPDVETPTKKAAEAKKYEAKVKKDELVRVLNSVKSFSNSGKNSISFFTMTFKAGSTEVLISLKDATLKFQDTMELEAPFTTDMNISLNVLYLSEMTSQFEGTVTLGLIGPNRPITVKYAEDQPINLVVPVRTTG